MTNVDRRRRSSVGGTKGKASVSVGTASVSVGSVLLTVATGNAGAGYDVSNPEYSEIEFGNKRLIDYRVLRQF